MAIYAAICVRYPNNPLIAAECANLTGGAPQEDGFAFCRTVAHIPNAAYVSTGLQLLAFGSTLDELLHAVEQPGFPADDFRIEFSSLSGKKRVSGQSAIRALADAIPFYPNLNHPRHRFLLIERDNGLWFGEILTECLHTYKQHKTRPYLTSASIPNRLSRALVNLVVPPAESILDPCCGTGSILLEAQSLGIQAYGADQNQRMVGMSHQNLAHFGYEASVEHADARTCQQTADAIVTNLPYGRFLQAEETMVREILERGRDLAPVAVYVAENDIRDWLVTAGYRDIVIYPVVKHDGFVRFVHLAQRCE
jgi:tRNA G10  N-methylase Trm11